FVPATRDGNIRWVTVATELPRLWTEQALAEELGVHPATLARARRAGLLGYTRVGHRVRYTAAHLAAYLALQEHAPSEVLGHQRAPSAFDAQAAHQVAREISGRSGSSVGGSQVRRRK